MRTHSDRVRDRVDAFGYACMEAVGRGDLERARLFTTLGYETRDSLLTAAEFDVWSAGVDERRRARWAGGTVHDWERADYERELARTAG